jgi:hypothetical protein
LRSEGTGQDASVASSLKQTSEIFLTELPDGRTELRMTISVDVLGRLGTFGLNVMKTKADRMWDEFAVKLQARLSPPAAVAPAAVSTASSDATPATVQEATTAAAHTAQPTKPSIKSAGWLAGLFGSASQAATAQAAPDWPHIRVDLKRGDTTATVYWPTTESKACADWLRQYA